MIGVVKDFFVFFFLGLVKLLLDIVAFVLGPFLFIWERVASGKRKTFKSILITGGNSGLGESLALAFAGPGVRLVLTARDNAKLQSVKEKCESKGSKVTVESVDVRDRKALEVLIEKVDNEEPLDLVIANAGVSPETLGLRNLDEYTKPLMEVNVDGVFNTIFPIIPRFRKRKNGQIAIMSSAAGLAPLASSPSYSASKACVRYFGESLRPLMAVDRVGVSVICPGFVRTPLTEKVRGTLFFMMTRGGRFNHEGWFGEKRCSYFISVPDSFCESFSVWFVAEARERLISVLAPKKGAKSFFKDV
eukprot:TRINITY_DN4013_c0_g1_i1.p1 TRINITY_DN4013_c0_g1~~TRINITY_DN4013_c0_g1_i1.p1  ORF type:complete len:304 (-),score=73.73 TRINITY_DN4013_c0_g1_i1:26-937(-)